MSQKKSNTQSTQASLEKRAERIINDNMKYDVDTRDHVSVALANHRFRKDDGDKEAKRAEQRLTESVRKAEADECLFDIKEIGREYVEAARLVYEVVTANNRVPDFIFNAVMVVLDEAQRQSGCEMWTRPSGTEDTLENYGYSIERMARLFRHNSMLNIKVEPKKDLAEMIAAVIEHPDCPQEIRDGINGATSDLFNRLNDDARKVYLTAPYIHALVVESKVQEGGTQ